MSHGGACVAIIIQSWPDHWSGARLSKVAVKAIRPSAARTSDSATLKGKDSACGGGGMMGRDGAVARIDGGLVIPPNRLARVGRKHPGHEIQRHDNQVGHVVAERLGPPGRPQMQRCRIYHAEQPGRGTTPVPCGAKPCVRTIRARILSRTRARLAATPRTTRARAARRA